MRRSWTLLVFLFGMGCVQPAPTSSRAPAPEPAREHPLLQAPSFGSIQDAIDSAATGVELSLPMGVYNESIELRDGVSLRGAGPGQTVLVGSITGESVEHLSLRGLSVQCSGEVGLALYDSVSISVADLVVRDCADAGVLILGEGGGLSFDRLELQRNAGYGFVADNTDEWLLSNSLLEGNGRGGLLLSNTGGASRVLHNTVVANGFAAAALPTDAAVSAGLGAGGTVRNNIVSGNQVALDCRGCTLDADFNLVWGNGVDYAGDAQVGPSDPSGDPRFRAPGERDWRLMPGSSAIDAGDPLFTVDLDRDGESRLQGSGSDLGMDEFRTPALSLTITEVMASPLVETTGEFVEVLNLGATGIELSGLLFSDGDETEELVSWNGSSTFVGPGAYALIVDAQYAGQYGVQPWVPMLTTLDLELGDGLSTGDPVRIIEAEGTGLVSTFSFPVDAGPGVAVERVRPSATDRPENWQASACPGGASPGESGCFSSDAGVEFLVLTEVLAEEGAEGPGVFIELFNAAEETVTLDGLILRDSMGTEDVLVSPSGGEIFIGAASHALIVNADFVTEHPLPPGTATLGPSQRQLGQGLRLDEGFELLTSEGSVVASFDPGVVLEPGVSLEKLSYAGGDGAFNWDAASGCCATGWSPGRLNGVSGGVCGLVLLTEVMASSSGPSGGNFLEVLNAGSDPINLSSLVLSVRGQAYTLGAVAGSPTTLQPGDYGLIVDADSPLTVGLEPDTALAALESSPLSDVLGSQDAVRLLEADGTSLIDGFLWPFEPGQGLSIERAGLAGGVNAAQWQPSPCAAGASPAADNCSASGEVGTAQSLLDLVITEVMYNPLVPSTGEFVEVYNSGVEAIDIAALSLWDGDSFDVLVPFFEGGSTVLQPGAVGLILDPGFDSDYFLPAEAVLLSPSDYSLGSGLAGDDPIVLFEADQLTVVDSYSWAVPAGPGVSIERLDPSAGDLVTNWAPSSCGASPGWLVCGGD